jgi:hypothetical protein
MKRNDISIEQLSELYDQLVHMLEEAPEHGKIGFTIHVRDGIAHRYETSREASIMLKRPS